VGEGRESFQTLFFLNENAKTYQSFGRPADGVGIKRAWELTLIMNVVNNQFGKFIVQIAKLHA